MGNSWSSDLTHSARDPCESCRQLIDTDKWIEHILESICLNNGKKPTPCSMTPLAGEGVLTNKNTHAVWGKIVPPSQTVSERAGYARFANLYQLDYLTQQLSRAIACSR